MKTELTAQRRSLCAMTGIAIGFRVFYAMAVDGGELYGSGWISVLLGLVMALPVGAALIALRNTDWSRNGGSAFRKAAVLILFAVLTYDLGAGVQAASGMVRYASMPTANRNIIKAVTAAAATGAALMGTEAAANAASMWKKCAAVLIGVLILAQVKYLEPAWITPLLGPGAGKLAGSAIPAAGMFCFASGGWLMLEPEHDKNGRAMLKTMIGCGLTAAALMLLYGMLVPGMAEEPPTRSFRIGRLLANGRAGLSLEMPYMALIYGCMLTTLVFETAAASKALMMAAGRLNARVCVAAVGLLAFGLSVSGAAESGMVRRVSMWYYPAIGLAVGAAGLAAMVRRKRGKG